MIERPAIETAETCCRSANQHGPSFARRPRRLATAGTGPLSRPQDFPIFPRSSHPLAEKRIAAGKIWEVSVCERGGGNRKAVPFCWRRGPSFTPRPPGPRQRRKEKPVCDSRHRPADSSTRSRPYPGNGNGRPCTRFVESVSLAASSKTALDGFAFCSAALGTAQQLCRWFNRTGNLDR